MKRTLRIFLLSLVGFAALVIFSCKPAPITIADTISSFVSSLNGNRSDTYKSFDPGLGSTYAALATPTYWAVAFPTVSIPYSFSPNPPNTSISTDVEVTISGGSGFAVLYKLSMTDTGTISENWLIHGMAAWTGSSWLPLF
jgi:hypothetical protein